MTAKTMAPIAIGAPAGHRAVVDDAEDDEDADERADRLDCHPPAEAHRGRIVGGHPPPPAATVAGPAPG